MAAWKTIRITKPCTLRLDNGNLVLEDDDVQLKFSLDDTDSIVFEGDRFTVSAKLLAALSAHKIAVLFCDAYYMPTAILHPYHKSALATRTIKAQLALPPDFAKMLWQELIRTKILLQKAVLEHLGKADKRLDRYLAQLRPGDKAGAEAKSARIYWSRLFKGLKREPDSFDLRNQALNYAYALIRSLITRDLSAAGFLPSLGIWHDNQYNAFNLSDDLMEPFRPIVDIGVYYILQKHQDSEYLSPDIKRDLITLLDKEYVIFEAGLSTLRTTSKRYIHSFKRSVMSKDHTLMNYPSFDPKHLNERV